MEKLVMWHKVADFDKWKAVFDADADRREKNEMKVERIQRFTLDPNTFVVEFSGENLGEKLNATLNDPSMGESMKEAGVEKMDFYLTA